MADEPPPIQAASRHQFAWKKLLFSAVTGIAVVSLIGNVVIYNHYTTHRPLVSVGKTVITKRQYQDTLEDAAGKQVLQKLVFAELIRQAATQADVMPTAQEITARIAQIRAQNPAVYAALPNAELRPDVTSLLALENLRIQNVTVTDGEISYYYLMHNAQLRPTPQAKAALIVTASLADAKAAAHMLGENIEPAIIAEQPGFHAVGINRYFLNLRTPGRAGLVRAILSMKPGKVRIFPLGKQFLTVEVYAGRAAAVPPLWRVKARVARLAKLEKAPTAAAELALLYQAAKPTFEIDKYAAYFIEMTRPTPSKSVP